jgi:hypothetical protein
MLDKNQLLELIRNGENSFVEFKDEAATNEKLAREITARDELQRLFQASANIHYEIIPVAGARVSDLDLSAFSEFMLNYRNLDVSQFDEPVLHRLLENLNLAVRADSTQYGSD